ncbi:MAG: hypothetical protein V4506_02730 [Bacteroidota bacterium]
MKTTALILSILVILLSCKRKSKEETNDPVVSSATTTTSTTSTPSQVSVASITLTSGAKTITVSGTCGWATVAGINYIGAKDQNKSLRVLEASFNIQSLPSQTTTYPLVAYDVNDTDPTHVSMSFSEQIGNGLLEWTSTSASANLKLVVSGNKVTVDLAGITLQAQTNSGFYTNLNTGDYANPGVLSGTLTFYK